MTGTTIKLSNCDCQELEGNNSASWSNFTSNGIPPTRVLYWCEFRRDIRLWTHSAHPIEASLFSSSLPSLSSWIPVTVKQVDSLSPELFTMLPQSHEFSTEFDGVSEWLMMCMEVAGSRSSSVITVSDYRLDDRGSIPGKGKGLFL
jgi:hypothetical protein